MSLRLKNAALLAALLSLVLGASTLFSTNARADEPANNTGNNNNTNNTRSGVTEGVLTAKGDGFIMVRANGERESTRLVPRWVGGTPAQGGGPDKRILLMIQKLQVGNRLKVAWIFEEKLRVIDIQLLPPKPEGNNADNDDNADDDDDAGNGDEPQGNGDGQNGNPNNGDQNAGNQDGDDGAMGDDDDDDDDDNNSGDQPPQPAAPNFNERAGAFDGVVSAKGQGWIMIRPDGAHESQKFFPRWLGGLPAQGGGLDRKMLQTFEQAPLGAHVHVEWQRDEQLRILVLRPATNNAQANR